MERGFVGYTVLRRHKPTKTNIPKPSSAREAGSGTGVTVKEFPTSGDWYCKVKLAPAASPVPPLQENVRSIGLVRPTIPESKGVPPNERGVLPLKTLVRSNAVLPDAQVTAPPQG